MADLKISALTSATTPLAGTEVLPIVQSGTTKQVSVANLTAARDVTMQTGNASQSVAAGVDLYTLQNINSTAVTTKYAGIKYRGRDTVNSGKDSAYIRTYPVDADFNNSYLSFWTRTSDSVTEKIQISSAGNLVIVNSGNGIDFSATSGTGTSELLADYEEGTFNAVISDGTTDATMGFSACQYTKVGRQVTICGYISTTDITGITGNLLLKGLPFAIASGLSYFSAGSIGSAGGLNILLGQVISMYGVGGSATADIRIWDALTGTTGLTPAEWSADGNMVFSLTYFA